VIRKTLFQFDTTLQSPQMIAFFTSGGCGVSIKLLKAGGPQVVIFFILALVGDFGRANCHDRFDLFLADF
jgi:ESS family glutamate:Na+ symporter